MGLRVVSDDGGPERFRQALFRALAGVVEIWMFSGGPAVICSLISPKGKRIGDMFAGTVVISERGPKAAPPPAMPPALAWWAASLQLSGLARTRPSWPGNSFPAHINWIRSYATRWHTGSPPMSLARVSPPPPAGAPPQYVLAAVLAERHRRELLRLSAVAPPPEPATPRWVPSPPPPSPPSPPSGFAPPG